MRTAVLVSVSALVSLITGCAHGSAASPGGEPRSLSAIPAQELITIHEGAFENVFALAFDAERESCAAHDHDAYSSAEDGYPVLECVPDQLAAVATARDALSDLETRILRSLDAASDPAAGCLREKFVARLALLEARAETSDELARLDVGQAYEIAVQEADWHQEESELLAELSEIEWQIQSLEENGATDEHQHELEILQEQKDALADRIEDGADVVLTQDGRRQTLTDRYDTVSAILGSDSFVLPERAARTLPEDLVTTLTETIETCRSFN